MYKFGCRSYCVLTFLENVFFYLRYKLIFSYEEIYLLFTYPKITYGES